MIGTDNRGAGDTQREREERERERERERYIGMYPSDPPHTQSLSSANGELPDIVLC